MNDNEIERAWLYAHGQMPDADKAEFEQLLRSDAALSREVEVIRRLDGNLRTLLPLAGKKDEEIEELILESMEHSTGAQPDQTPRTVIPFKNEPEPAADRRQVSAFWRMAFAMAACLLVAVGIYVQYPAPPIECSTTEIVRIKSRGDEPPAQGAYSDAELQSFCDDVSEVIPRSYDRVSDSGKMRIVKRKEWRLFIRIHELYGSNFMIYVRARRPDGSTDEKDWSQDFSDSSDFDSRKDAFADTIARDLWNMR